MIIIDALGIGSAVIVAVMFVPQIVHTYTTRDYEALHTGFLGLNFLACSLGMVYAVFYKVVPMIICNSSGMLFSLLIFSFKLCGTPKPSPPKTITQV